MPKHDVIYLLTKAGWEQEVKYSLRSFERYFADLGTWRFIAPGFVDVSTKGWPPGDVPNDDSNMFNVQDEDEDEEPLFEEMGLVSDNIFVRDMPGMPTRDAGYLQRLIQRHNMREFVRLKFDGQPFQQYPPNQKPTKPEGSRSSDKLEWHSQIDLVNDWSVQPDPANPITWKGRWKRNGIPSALNDIDVGVIDIDAPITPVVPP